MNNRSVKIGLIGAGYWGTKLCEEYLALSNSSQIVELKWVSDSMASSLESIRKRFELPKDIRLTSNYSELLEDPSLDAVHIAVPNELHFQIARDALEAGKHVLLEKPMATSSREAFKLASLAQESGLVLQVGHIFRFNNAVRLVRNLIKSDVGRVYYLILNWATHMEPPKGRDIVFDLGPHPIDVLNFLLEEWPSRVQSFGKSYVRGNDEEDMAFVNLQFPDRMTASIYLSWINLGKKERSIEVVCEKATIKCDALGQGVVMYDNAGEKRLEVEPNNTIRDMEAHFAERVASRGPSYNDALTGAVTVNVLEAIRQSMKEGAVVITRHA